MADTIKLQSKQRAENFTFPHALNILRWQAQNGRSDWQIHESEKYKFVNNDIVRKRNNRPSKKSKSDASD